MKKRLVLITLLFVLLVPATAYARYDDVVRPAAVDLTAPAPKIVDEIDPVAIVDYTVEYEMRVAADAAQGIRPWYDDPEWQAAAAWIEIQPEHWESVDDTQTP